MPSYKQCELSEQQLSCMAVLLHGCIYLLADQHTHTHMLYLAFCFYLICLPALFSENILETGKDDLFFASFYYFILFSPLLKLSVWNNLLYSYYNSLLLTFLSLP